MVKVLIASLIVGTVLAHFGIKIDALIKSTGLSPERIEDLAGKAWSRRCRTCCSGQWSSCQYVCYPSVPAARRKPRLIAPKHFTAPLHGAVVPRDAVSLVSSEAAMTATPTTAIMMVQTAFISGFTPRRTSE